MTCNRIILLWGSIHAKADNTHFYRRCKLKQLEYVIAFPVGGELKNHRLNELCSTSILPFSHDFLLSWYFSYIFYQPGFAFFFFFRFFEIRQFTSRKSSHGLFITSIKLFFWNLLKFSFKKFDFLGELRHLSSNKEFISRLDDGQFEVVHPFQVRDKNERIGIDTR